MEKISHVPRNQYVALSALLIVLLGLIAIVYKYHHATPVIMATNNIKNKSASTDQSPPNTHQEQSNGQTFPVPNSVPSGSIHNYTLITQNEDYMIQELNGVYKITLYAIINNPAESASYQQELHDYKQQALQYLTQHGVDTNKVTITYDPSEAAQD